MSTRRLGELEDVIGEVAASYGAGRLIDSLSSAQLPNKRQVIEALNHLKAVMYLGYYATGELHEQKLRHAVSAHLYPAYEILCEQIRRAVSYEGFRSTSCPARRRLAGGRHHRVPAQGAAASAPCSPRTSSPPSRATRPPTASRRSSSATRRSRRSRCTASPTSSTARACRCCRGSWRSTRIRSPASTSTPARRSASRSSSTTAPASSSARRP